MRGEVAEIYISIAKIDSVARKGCGVVFERAMKREVSCGKYYLRYIMSFVGTVIDSNYMFAAIIAVSQRQLAHG